MILTKEEEQLVLAHRKQIQGYKEAAQKKAKCDHRWNYRGDWRGESHYVCDFCSETKWE